MDNSTLQQKKAKLFRSGLTFLDLGLLNELGTQKLFYFFTQTYDDQKMTEEQFCSTLKRFLRNLHFKFGVLYTGRFECCEESGRLHFHAVLYAPKDFLGEFDNVFDWSETKQRMLPAMENIYLKEHFGDNRFEILNNIRSLKNRLDYIKRNK